MTVLVEDGTEVRTQLRAKPPIIEPTESIYELEINGKKEAKKRKMRYKKPGEEGQSGKSNRKSSRMTTILQQFPMGRSKCKGEKLYLLLFRG